MADDSFNSFIAGSVGGILGTIVGYPFDTIKVRIQTMQRTNNKNNIINCIKKTFRNENIGGFYKGLLSPLLTVSLVNATVFYSFDITKKTYRFR